jgi:uncharacterized membrane protein YhaH (DUF805 family)
MNCAQSVKTCFKKYADFKGVASRPEYWYFYLFTIIGNIIFTAAKLPAFKIIWILALLLPSSAVATRRFRDGGHNPLWVIVIIVSQIASLALGNRGAHKTSQAHASIGAGGLGVLVLVFVGLAVATIVFLCQKPKLTSNKYFPDRADTSLIETPVTTQAGNYCSNCGKLKLPGQRECQSCGQIF